VTTTKHKPPRATEPAMLELLQSEKFLNWKPEEEPEKPFSLDDLEQSQITREKHWSVNEVAEAWGVSTDLVRDVFKDEDGVLVIDRPGTRVKRGYSTMRIPESVLEAVYARLSKR
jgi:hypothetical protein